jgi:serine/threonine protein kinase
LPNLEVHELLGHGGMGVVYKGRQPYLERQVAIKLVRPDVTDREGSRQRFIREARALAKLLHPFIVTVFDFGEVGDLCYLVMEYVEGTSLRQLLSRKALSSRDVLDFMPQIGEALHHAHEIGIVHRDIKPENILIDRRDRVRLVDFGLARVLGPQAQSHPEDQQISGTYGYMAPEMFSSPEGVDHRADIYSSGVVFFEMLTGELPRGEPVPPSSRSAADPRLDPIVLRALEHDRERRYQQMRQMNSDIVLATRTPESTIRLVQIVPAPIDQVFAAWTTPAVMTNWFAPTDEYTTPITEADPRVGGSYKVGMKHIGSDHTNLVTGQYCRIEPPRRLSFTWAWEAPRPDVHETQVTLEFQPQGDATELTLIHERFRDDDLKQKHNEGWTGCLSRLARKLSH